MQPTFWEPWKEGQTDGASSNPVPEAQQAAASIMVPFLAKAAEPNPLLKELVLGAVCSL